MISEVLVMEKNPSGGLGAKPPICAEVRFLKSPQGKNLLRGVRGESPSGRPPAGRRGRDSEKLKMRAFGFRKGIFEMERRRKLLKGNEALARSERRKRIV